MLLKKKRLLSILLNLEISSDVNISDKKNSYEESYD